MVDDVTFSTNPPRGRNPLVMIYFTKYQKNKKKGHKTL